MTTQNLYHTWKDHNGYQLPSTSCVLRTVVSRYRQGGDNNGWDNNVASYYLAAAAVIVGCKLLYHEPGKWLLFFILITSIQLPIFKHKNKNIALITKII